MSSSVLPPLPPPPGENVHLALGNPSKAASNVTNPNNYLVLRPQFALSYNKTLGGPNWASWHLERADLGAINRSDDYAPDPLLPQDWRITSADYAGSGYNRAQLCPAGDRSRSATDNRATRVMSNMLPQTGDLYREPWRKLEEYCRTLVTQGNELYIIAGGYRSRRKIAGGKINVPASLWKVIVILPEGDNDLARINERTRVIAVYMPNVTDISEVPWKQYKTTVDSIEATTGYDFLSSVPKPVQSRIEAGLGQAG